ncbi:MAG: hypothetical protein ACYSX0_22395 [Planctomycetota bacterium]|jgi:hypothetical protein
MARNTTDTKGTAAVINEQDVNGEFIGTAIAIALDEGNGARTMAESMADVLDAEVEVEAPEYDIPTDDAGRGVLTVHMCIDGTDYIATVAVAIEVA